MDPPEKELTDVEKMEFWIQTLEAMEATKFLLDLAEAMGCELEDIDWLDE